MNVRPAAVIQDRPFMCAMYPESTGSPIQIAMYDQSMCGLTLEATGPQPLRRSRLLQLRVHVGRPVKVRITKMQVVHGAVFRPRPIEEKKDIRVATTAKIPATINAIKAAVGLLS